LPNFIYSGKLDTMIRHDLERLVLAILAFVLAAGPLGLMGGHCMADQESITCFARFQIGDTSAYGRVEGDRIRQLRGDLFGTWQPTETVYNLADVKLLVPTRPSKVLALAGNYKSHLEDKPASPNPELFLKSPSCLIADGENVIIPLSATDVHFEAEMVIVIGKRAKKVPVTEAHDYVFGVTCGNDISERVWQKNDVQWVRAKASDTFGPCGPYIVRGLNYDDLLLQMRVNGQVKQRQRTRDLVHCVAEIVSWASLHMTLQPGDLIYTGTPGTTTAIRPGDRMEVELEGVGVLTNPVVGDADAPP
jgi:2-keto-4-pentenoate hydratase/2-oxohepta-3-ene-1,7-dioic acid hydratase in catechol pathway